MTRKRKKNRSRRKRKNQKKRRRGKSLRSLIRNKYLNSKRVSTKMLSNGRRLQSKSKKIGSTKIG